jgi:hypothetical protein
MGFEKMCHGWIKGTKEFLGGRKGVIPCICMYKYTEWLSSEFLRRQTGRGGSKLPPLHPSLYIIYYRLAITTRILVSKLDKLENP